MPRNDRRDRPLIRPPLGLLFERPYRAIVNRRNRAFDRGERVTRLPVPVISVGNLSVGGTGKTPTVELLVRWLLEAGRRPAVAMRGYARASDARSDEQAQYESSFPGLPVVAQPDRLSGLRPLVERASIDTVVLDDGFQHRFIARDLDIVLLDATRDAFADRCLPAGWLREPVESLSRAHVILLTHAQAAGVDALEKMESNARRLAPRALILRASHVWTSLRARDVEHPLDSLVGRRVLACCGIGNPAPFLAQAARTARRPVESLIRPDHHRWSAADLREIARKLRPAAAEQSFDALLTTEKDWVKLRELDLDSLRIPLLRPALSIDFGPHAEALRRAVLSAAAPT